MGATKPGHPNRWAGLVSLIRESGAIPYALTGRVLKHSAITAVFVGCILSLLNEGDGLVEGRLSAHLFVKIAINFVVPFLVSSVSAAANRCAHFPTSPQP